MGSEQRNKEIVTKWFTNFWGKNFDASVVDELAAPDMTFNYSIHAPRKGRSDIKAFMVEMRKAFPDLNFWGTSDLIAEGDYVVSKWEGGGTHTGPAFSDFIIGGLPTASGKKMLFPGISILKVQNGLIVEEVGQDDGLIAMQQLGIVQKV
jgi:predicted ester cyclase